MPILAVGLRAFADVTLNILSPILLLIAVGALMRRAFKIDLTTLSKLCIYVLVPAFVFDKVSNSTLDWSKMAGIVAMSVIQVVTLGLLVLTIGLVLRLPRQTLAAVAMAVMFYNSGNYGIPLAELAYQSRGGEVQAFVLMTQNILTFTLGLAIAAWAHGGGVGKGLIALLKLPVLPTLAAALLARAYLKADPSHHLPIAISATTHYLSAALVPIALMTLGVQLAINPRWPRWRPVGLVLILRLALGPVQMALLLLALHWTGHHWGGLWTTMDLWPWPAELLIVTAAVPTAVNTLLLTLEMNGDADLAADCVFWTTITSCLTITLWLLAARAFFA